MPIATDAPEFMFLLLQPNRGPHPSPEEMARIMARFGEWMEAMTAKGAVVATAGLDPAGHTLRGPRGAIVTDGPHPEATEIVGGYVIVRAPSLAAALDLARGCPGLDYRMAVEVRPLMHRKAD